jgi:hypothetical protein
VLKVKCAHPQEVVSRVSSTRRPAARHV